MAPFPKNAKNFRKQKNTNSLNTSLSLTINSGSGPTFIINGEFPKGALQGVVFGKNNQHSQRQNFSKKSGAHKKAIKAGSKFKDLKLENGVILRPSCIGDSAAAWHHVKKSGCESVMALGISGAGSAKILAKMPEFIEKIKKENQKQLLVFVGCNDAQCRDTGVELCDAAVCAKNWNKIIDFATDFGGGLDICVTLPYIRSTLNTKYQKLVLKC